MKSGLASFKICISVCFIGFFYIKGFSQEVSNEGIKFENGLSWHDIVKKATEENKLIFVDCYTTWCLPCKKMEQQVYPLKEVGMYFKEHFVSVKFQMDTTDKDSELVKDRYEDATRVKKVYSVNAFPTFLFFTPNGKLLYKNSGLQDATALIKTASDVANPENNYYEFLEEYKKGKRDYRRFAFMAFAAMRLKDTVTANKLAKEYLATLKGNDLFTKNNIDFLAEFTRTTKDRGFNLIYKNSQKINSIMQDQDYSQKVIQSLIYRTHVTDVLTKASAQNEHPDFDFLERLLTKQFGSYYAKRVIASAKPGWYRKQKDYKQYAKYLVLFFNQYEFPSFPLFKSSNNSTEDFVLNNYAWEVFKYSDDKEELTKALAWSNRAVMMNPAANWIDTYANLLYKIGETGLAIQWEMIASQVEPKDESIKQNLDAMKMAKPTWPKIR